MIEILISGLLGGFFAVIIELYLGKGFVKRREMRELTYDLESLEHRFNKLHAKCSMGNIRTEKKERLLELQEKLPILLEQLPLPEEQKALIKSIPPEMIIKWLKNEGIL